MRSMAWCLGLLIVAACGGDDDSGGGEGGSSGGSSSGGSSSGGGGPGSGWGTPELIETDDLGPAGNAEVAMDPSGAAIAIWSQYDGSSVWNIQANVFR